MSVITVSLYLVKGVLQESNSNSSVGPGPHATTDIVSGDTITWVKGTDSGISSIDLIAPVSPGLTFTPSPIHGLTTYEVTGIDSKDPYNYNISYTPVGGLGSTINDPKIKINPGTSGS